MPSLPKFTKPFFWDVDFASLDTEADYYFIIERLLEHSDDKSFFWLLNNYSDGYLKEVIKNSRSLSHKTGYFWKSYFGLKEGELKCLQPPSHRAASRSIFPLHFYHCQIADIRDLAPIKLDTVGSRGSKKDFIDLYFIANEAIPLKEVFNLYRNKYSHLQINMKHLIMSLTYFEDADKSRDEIIMLNKTVTWPEIKKYFEKQAKKILEEIKTENI